MSDRELDALLKEMAVDAIERFRRHVRVDELHAIVRDLAASEDTAGTENDGGYRAVACHFCGAEPQLIAEGDFYMDMELDRHERGCVYRRACELVNQDDTGEGEPG